jgi:hypothetical protein
VANHGHSLDAGDVVGVRGVRADGAVDGAVSIVSVRCWSANQIVGKESHTVGGWLSTLAPNGGKEERMYVPRAAVATTGAGRPVVVVVLIVVVMTVVAAALLVGAVVGGMVVVVARVPMPWIGAVSFTRAANTGSVATLSNSAYIRTNLSTWECYMCRLNEVQRKEVCVCVCGGVWDTLVHKIDGPRVVRCKHGQGCGQRQRHQCCQ